MSPSSWFRAGEDSRFQVSCEDAERVFCRGWRDADGNRNAERGRTMLVLEDPGGEPLDRLLGGPMEVGTFLRLAVALSGAVGRLHERGLIHKDIKPAHVLVTSATGQVWLTGFGIASRLPRERQLPEPPGVIAGTLAYMAPEQTGRTNRSIDSRSDLYSLGVRLYEMLSGSPGPCLCHHHEAARQDCRGTLPDSNRR
jgi:serine/threonine protein kinase